MNRIPHRLSVFWTGRMNWLRYMSLYSFRKLNDNWKIDLYQPAPEAGITGWSGEQTDDATYEGPDYTQKALDELNVTPHVWIPPFKGLCAAQASDIFQWQLLATVGGFYSDMDVLWLRPVYRLWRSVRSCHAVFCLEGSHMAIGFCASSPESRIFADIAASVHEHVNFTSDYQGYGSNLIYRFASITGPMIRRGWAHRYILNNLRSKYPDLDITAVSSDTVYPYDWRVIPQIFQAGPVPTSAYGLHWFGGNPQAQRFARKISPETLDGQRSVIANCIRHVLEYQP